MIGLTGGIGSGKSTVAGFIKEKGIKVIDADQVAREIVEPGKPALREINEEFGPNILKEDGTLNRKKLGGIIFSDKDARQRLNKITHPRIRKRMFEKVDEKRKDQGGKGLIVLEVPLLIEVGLYKSVDRVWVVSASETSQIQRLMKRDRISREEAAKRIQSQMPLYEKEKYADAIIDNNQEPKEVREQVHAMIDDLLKKIDNSCK